MLETGCAVVHYHAYLSLSQSILWIHDIISTNKVFQCKNTALTTHFIHRKKSTGRNDFFSSFVMYKWIPRDNFLFLLFNFRLKCEFNNQTASFRCRNVIPDAEPQYIYFPASITNKNAHMTMFNSSGKRRWSILTKNKHWKKRRTQAFFYAKTPNCTNSMFYASISLMMDVKLFIWNFSAQHVNFDLLSRSSRLRRFVLQMNWIGLDCIVPFSMKKRN